MIQFKALQTLFLKTDECKTYSRGEEGAQIVLNVCIVFKRSGKLYYEQNMQVTT